MIAPMKKILIDGYNYLMRNGLPCGQAGRAAFTASIKSYIGEKHIRATLVFDGSNAERFDFPSKETHGAVDVVYSCGTSADEVIRGLVAESCGTKELLVVSSDRAHIGSFCRRHAVQVITSEEFHALIKKRSKKLSSKRIPASEKPSSSSEDELTYYLKKFGV